MSLDSCSHRAEHGFIRVRVVLLLIVLGLAPFCLWADAPAWWAQRGVINSAATADDYAAVNQGQVKNIAKQGYEEVKDKLGSAGATLDSIWATPATSTDDYQAVNIGQLKNVAKPFYDQLISVGYTTQYPWAVSENPADDYALANIGQVKNLFSFDLSSFAITNGATIFMVSGDQQVGPSGQVLPLALKVRVVNGQGLPVTGATVTFAVSGGAGTLGAASGGGTVTTLTATTGLSGQAVAYWKVSGGAGDINQVSAAINQGSVAFKAFISGGANSAIGGAVVPDPIGGVTIDAGGDPEGMPNGAALLPSVGDIEYPVLAVAATVNTDPFGVYPSSTDWTKPHLTWTDGSFSSSVTSYRIEVSIDNGEWATVADISGVHECDGENLIAGRLYEYRVRLLRSQTTLAFSNIVAYDVPRISRIDVSYSLYGASENAVMPPFVDGGHGIGDASVYDWYALSLDLFVPGKARNVGFDVTENDSSSETPAPKFVRHVRWSSTEVHVEVQYNEYADQYFSGVLYGGVVVQGEGSSLLANAPASIPFDSVGESYVAATTWTKPDDPENSYSWTGGSSLSRHTIAEVHEYIPYYINFNRGHISCYSLSMLPDPAGPAVAGIKWDGRSPITIERPDYGLNGTHPLALTWSFAGGANPVLVYRYTQANPPYGPWTKVEAPVSNGSQINPGDKFEIVRNEAGGELTSIRFTLTDSDTTDGVGTTINYTYSDAAGVNIPTSESSGAKYRKIALNGAPLSDEKPQQSAESDQQAEETFIDALTLGLRHDTTDTYTVVPASDLALSVRRSATSEVWNLKNGLRLEERPDRPFGAGWTSNLAANIHFAYGVGDANPDGSNPDTATVTDENGAEYTFAILYAAGASYDVATGYSGSMTFVPLPSSNHEQSIYLCSLVKEGNNYTFKRKFGAVLAYSMTSLQTTLAADRIHNSHSGTKHAYARLDTVKDRYGNRLDYAYSSSNTVVPATIAIFRTGGGTGAVLSIRQDANGHITDVWDPKGYKVHYDYADSDYFVSAAGSAPFSYTTLSTVTSTDGQTTGYTHVLSTEADQNPSTAANVGSYYHLELTSITDALNHTYVFGYAFDHKKYDYSSDAPDDHYYVKTGLPMQVTQTTLPDNTYATFANDSSNLKVERDTTTGAESLKADYVRRNHVIDAKGNQRDYDFTVPQVEELPSFATTYKHDIKLDNPRMVYYTTMEISSYQGSGEDKARLGSESFDFDPNSGMSVTRATDFSGNTTTYVYGDAFANTLFTDAGASSMLYGRYSDPTSQTNALSKTKHFTYGANRIMTSSTDENGTVTEWAVDSMGRRLSETVTDANGVLLSSTSFYYKDTTGAYLQSGVNYANVSRNFLTKKVVKKNASFATDPSWVTDLVTVYVPDANSRVAQEIVDPTGLALTTAYTYDLNGNKQTSTDPRNNTTTFSYDQRNRLIAVTYADHHQKQLFYDARGNKTEEVDENGVATFWQYDALNRVTNQILDMDGSLKTLAAATNHVLGDTVTLDRSVHIVTSYSYNALNAKERVMSPKLTKTSSGGFRTTETKFEYDALQRLKKKTDDYGATSEHLNYVTTYDYEPAKNPGGSVFDSSGWKPTKVTDPRNYVTEVTYDALYRPTVETTQYASSAYATTTKDYDDVGNLLTVTAPPATVDGVLQSTGTITKTTYDGLHRPTSVTEAYGITALEATTTTDYTSTGLAWRSVSEITRTPTAASRTTTTEYDHAGRPVKVFAPAVDDALTSEATLVTPVTETRYDEAGNVSYVINPLGQRTDYGYDTRNRRQTEQLPSVTDAVTGQASRPTRITAYDGVGNVIAVQDARGFITTTNYDNARRPWRVIAPPMTLADGTTVHPETVSHYDSAGNVLTLTDANGHVTTNTYDALNRLKTTLQKPDSDSAHDILVTNEYDAAGNRTAVIDGKSQRTEFTYDGLNRNLTVKDPASQLVTFTYDAINKVARVDSESRRTEYAYDARHRLKDVTYVGRIADNRHYDYDLAGQLLAVTESGKGGKADVAYAYDALGRQLTETSGGKTHAYGYDLANNRVTVTYGGTGTALTSTYDALNRLHTLTENSRTTTYGYDLNGNRVLQQLPNGEEVDTQYDPLNRSTAITTSKSSGALLLQLVQAYDPAGNLVKLTERHYGTTLAPRTVTNTYDNVNRLVIEVNTMNGSSAVTSTYVYDAANNRTQKRVAHEVSGGFFGSYTSTVVTHYAVNVLNQLQSATEDYATGGISVPNLTPHTVTSFTYDANGNRLTRSFDGDASISTNAVLTDAYAYDYENRLVGLTKNTAGGTGTYAYVYDYRTRRVERTENGTITQSVFSGGLSVQEYAGGSLTAQYIRGSDWGGGVGGLLYSVRSGAPLFDHFNGRGDLIGQTDASGASTWQGTYEAFGKRTQESGSTPDRQKANTKEEDPTGLLNEGFRYRDLETGAFITRDPLGFVDGPNMYAYVVQNPWSKFDPEGLQETPTQEKKEEPKKEEAPVTVRYPKEVQDQAEQKAKQQNPGGQSAKDAQSPNAKRNMSPDGVKKLGKIEGGFQGQIYDDTAGNPTIGYGHKLKPGEAEKYKNGITEEQAQALLKADVASAESAVRKNVKVPLSQNQFDALTSFTFNAGNGAFAGSTLVKKLNAGDTASVPGEMVRWNKETVNGKVVTNRGLTNRRADEAQWFQQPDNPPSSSSP